MGERWWLCVMGMCAVSLGGCDEAEPRPERIEIASAHRSCDSDQACGVVETSCQSQGCECGVAVSQAHLLDYQQELAECRGQGELATCDFRCETQFGKCFEGACVLTDEPPELFRRGRSVQTTCERSRGTYRGCPDCPPGERCASCSPCDCPTTHRWTKKGCARVIKTEARDIQIETRPSVASTTDKIKTRVHNGSRQPIWLKAVCGTPFYRVRKKEDAWEKGYEPFHAKKCRVGALEIAPGASRPFVVGNLRDFREASGELATPGSYRFEVTYTDGTKSFRHHGIAYSAEFDVAAKLSRR
jgi:hypothetical protein